jgi:TP901 family phage tail tape measure protein
VALSGAGLKAGQAIIELTLKGAGAVEGQLKQLESKTRRIGAAFSRVGTIGLSMAAAFAAPLGAAVKLASDAAESTNKFNAVFKDQAKVAGEWASQIANSVGRSKTEIQDALSAFQGFFVGLGFGSDKAREMSQQIESLTLDFASFHNLTDEEAMQRFISALSGSSETLDKFGVNTKQAALEAELFRMGVKKSWTEVTEQEKAVARLNIIMQSMTAQGAVGDAVKTAGSFANRMKALRARIKDTGIEIGTILLPAATEWLGRAQKIATAIAKWVSENKELVASIASIVLKVGAASVILIALGKAIAGVTVAVKALQVAIAFLTAHPMVALATAIGAVVVAVLHFTGALEKLFGWLNRISGVPHKIAGEIDEMTQAMKDAAKAKQDMTIDEQIEAVREQMHIYAAHPKTFAKLKAEMQRLEKFKADIAAARTTNAADNPFATIEAEDALNTAADWVKDKWGEAADKLKELQIDIGQRLNKILDPEVQQRLAPIKAAATAGKSVAHGISSGRSAEALFDTRLARQVFGGGNRVEQEQLETQRKMLAKLDAINKKRGGIVMI